MTSNWGVAGIMLLIFAVYMFAFDKYSYFDIKELNREIDVLQQQCDNLRVKIAADSAIITGLEDDEYLERYAREHFRMKKEGETMYIINSALNNLDNF
ncbi:Cell division protein DivIC/FtsB [Mucinivorans hirudinis]|uniref:Cell division protein DivIC/FtsB n=1 Tax=Mucinivorans hirudinis TaxID=1433126 RepID=A0A060REG6_9BACT|nr:Cell division protein DivIC/FtsB [Mucinivorans hirudinis]